MLNNTILSELRAKLPQFSLQRPCNTTLLPEEFTDYFELYGFYDTLKDFDGDYFLGTHQPRFGGKPTVVAVHYWRQLEAKGTILIVHGLFDHVGLFQNLIRYFLGLNYSVVALDLPGHGLSGGIPTDVKHFADYSSVLGDTLALIPPQQRQAPVYGLGQSTGAAVLTGLMMQYRQQGQAGPFERLVFFGPLIRPRRWRLGRLTLKLIGPYMHSIQRDINAMNSHDEQFHNFLRYHDPLQSRRLRVSWVRALDEWVNICNAPHSPFETPLLIVQGTADKVVDWQKNVPRFKQLFNCHQINFVEGAMHHLANEADPWRQAIYASTSQFLKQRVVCKVK